jgi:glycosyltransferase involved in cell wall biosynthesis
VVDFIDALSLTYQRRAAASRFPMRELARMEMRRLRAYEQELAARAALSLAVGEEDARHISPRVQVVPNSVDLEVFSPPADRPRSNDIIMTGNFNYLPNVEAAEWFVRDIFPSIASACPQTRLRLAGADPSPRVQALVSPRVEVTGFVPSVAAELQRAAVAVAPICSGAGIKNKILEAMACATPVVATSMANAGINAAGGRELLLADAPAEFALEVISLIQDPNLAARIGTAGRALVERAFSPETTGRKLLALYETLEATRS